MVGHTNKLLRSITTRTGGVTNDGGGAPSGTPATTNHLRPALTQPTYPLQAIFRSMHKATGNNDISERTRLIR